MKDLVNFFRLSRPLNVVITLISFALAAFLASNRQIDFIYQSDFWYVAVCLMLITATGYWVNDAFDFKIDQINKPEKTIVGPFLSRKKVLSVYFGALVGIAIFSLFTLQLRFTLLNLGAMGLLFLYAWRFKRVSVVGNVMIAFLTGLVIFYAGFLLDSFTTPLLWTIMLAFEITFIREVTKDIEDIRGDLRFRLNTLPIRIGIRNTKKILYAAYGLFFASCWLPFLDSGLRGEKEWNWIYLVASLVLVQFPAGLLLQGLTKAYKPEDFGRQSRWIKMLIFTGIVTVLLLN